MYVCICCWQTNQKHTKENLNLYRTFNLSINRLNTSISILWEWILLKGLSSFEVLYLSLCPQLLATNLRSLRNPTRDIIVNIFSAKYFVSARLIYLHKVEL